MCRRFLERSKRLFNLPFQAPCPLAHSFSSFAHRRRRVWSRRKVGSESSNCARYVSDSIQVPRIRVMIPVFSSSPPSCASACQRAISFSLSRLPAGDSCAMSDFAVSGLRSACVAPAGSGNMALASLRFLSRWLFSVILLKMQDNDQISPVLSKRRCCPVFGSNHGNRELWSLCVLDSLVGLRRVERAQRCYGYLPVLLAEANEESE